MRRPGCFVQFAKAPREGMVKTRLQPAVSPAQAADIARAMTLHVARCLEQRPAHWDVLLCADDSADAFLRGLAESFKRPLLPQGEGDLGERMARAATKALESHRAVIIVGSDCVDYDPGYLQQAARALEAGDDAVLGPALDGGYVLVGFTSVPSGVFRAQCWSSDSVLDTQRARFRELGLSWQELPPRADIDGPGDLWRLAALDQALAIGRVSP
jgi:uncharacterized protein